LIWISADRANTAFSFSAINNTNMTVLQTCQVGTIVVQLNVGLKNVMWMTVFENVQPVKNVNNICYMLTNTNMATMRNFEFISGKFNVVAIRINGYWHNYFVKIGSLMV
jgi:hypothetical protein